MFVSMPVDFFEDDARKGVFSTFGEEEEKKEKKH